MYWPPEYELKLFRQRHQELIERAERARLLGGVRPVTVHVRLRAAWRAFFDAGPTEGRPATQR